jgi:hypothetical protein
MGTLGMSTTCANFQLKCEAHPDNPSFYADTTCGTIGADAEKPKPSPPTGAIATATENPITAMI